LLTTNTGAWSRCWPGSRSRSQRTGSGEVDHQAGVPCCLVLDLHMTTLNASSPPASIVRGISAGEASPAYHVWPDLGAQHC
jgi:hypothetical protein